MTVVGLSASLALAVSLVAPYAVLPALRRLNVVDVPSSRSSHSSTAVRGLGLATLTGLLAGGVIMLGWGDSAPLIICILAASAAAALTGWLEDYKGVPIRYRVAGQLVIGFTATSAVVAVTGSEPWIVPVGGIFVTGFINVANFMDGVDGLSGFNGVVIGGTYAVWGWLETLPWMAGAGLVLAAAHTGFLPWNLGRRKMFLGDSGSYLLGSAVSVIALAAICSGVPLLAVLGPLAIYLADTTWTLLSRIISGKRWYESHRSHIYHQLEDLGVRHLQIAALVAVGSCATGVMGALATCSAPWGAALYGSIGLGIVAAYLTAPSWIRRWASARPVVPAEREDRHG